MIEWVQKGDDWETTIGYTRVQLWRHLSGSKMSKSWRLSLFNLNHWPKTDDPLLQDFLMFKSASQTHQTHTLTQTLRTQRIDTAKKRACKKLIEILTDQRDTIDAWLKQLKD